MVSLVNIRALIGKSISRGKTPRNAAMFQIPLDFAVDLSLKFSAAFDESIQNAYGFAGPQSVKMDNSLNPDVLVLKINNGDTITCPAYSMGIFPLLYNGGVLEFEAISLFPVATMITLLNTREQAQIWTTKIPLAGTVNVTGSTVFAQKPVGGYTLANPLIVAGGVSQQIFAANANRKAIYIRNPGTAASQGLAAPENLFVSWTGAAGPTTWELFPGEQIPALDPVPSGAISVYAATTGHQIVAYQS